MARAASSASMMNGIGNSLPSVISVRTNPGQTVVTRTPRRPTSARSASSRLICAALVAP